MHREQRPEIQLGKFYRSVAGEIWCCFRARPLVKDYGTHTQSYCVRVNDDYITYFLDECGFGEGGEVEYVLCECVAEAEVQRLPWRTDLPP